MIQGEDGVVKRRGPLQAIWATAENYVYFLAPMVLADRAALGLKPLLMEPTDLRGPWECLWHKVIQSNVKFKFDKSSKYHEKLNNQQSRQETLSCARDISLNVNTSTMQ